MGRLQPARAVTGCKWPWADWEASVPSNQDFSLVSTYWINFKNYLTTWQPTVYLCII